MPDVLNIIGELGLIPVLVIDDAEDAVRVAAALRAGGIPAAEVTFRTDAAEAAIRNIVAALPDILIGAGTILSRAQASRAVTAGARFIVSPGLNPAVVDFCLQHATTAIPGCSTPTDLALAVDLGLRVVKFFPAEACGGMAYLNAISAPFGDVRFIPSGGITSANLNTYLCSPRVLACGGTWVAERDLIQARAFDEITRMTRQAVSAMLGFRLVGAGLTGARSDAVASALSALGMPLAAPGPDQAQAGALGEIVLETNDLRRAMGYLGRAGVRVDAISQSRPAGGPADAAYLPDGLGGFAVRLRQRE